MTVRLATLDNGLRLVTDRIDTVDTVSLGLWVEVGTRHEAPEINGVAHFLEHMAFKGTERRNAREIAEEIEAVGGDLNAATSVESTAYYARVLKADVPLALDVLSDILSEPAFDPEELRREQNVVVQEIGAVEDAPDDLVFERLHETAFPEQPVGRSILGTPETVRSFNSARLRGYLARNYRAPGMLVAAAGAIEHKRILAEAEKRFASFIGPSAPVPAPAQFGGGIRVETRDLEQVHIALALQGLAVRDEQLYSLQVFTNVLGGGMSSRLFQEAREKRGLCYAIHAFHMPYSDTGLFALYAGTDEADASELMRVVIDQLAIATETLNDTEVARAKAQMKAGLLMALESSEARLGQIARQMLAYGRPIPLDEIVAKVDAVTVTSARAAGRALIGRGRPAIAALGPGTGLERTAALAESLMQRAA